MELIEANTKGLTLGSIIKIAVISATVWVVIFWGLFNLEIMLLGAKQVATSAPQQIQQLADSPIRMSINFLMKGFIAFNTIAIISGLLLWAGLWLYCRLFRSITLTVKVMPTQQVHDQKDETTP